MYSKHIIQQHQQRAGAQDLHIHKTYAFGNVHITCSCALVTCSYAPFTLYVLWAWGSLQVLLVACSPGSCRRSLHSCLAAGSRRITFAIDLPQTITCVFKCTVKQLLQVCSTLLLGDIPSPLMLGKRDHVPTLRCQQTPLADCFCQGLVGLVGGESLWRVHINAQPEWHKPMLGFVKQGRLGRL